MKTCGSGEHPSGKGQQGPYRGAAAAGCEVVFTGKRSPALVLRPLLGVGGAESSDAGACDGDAAPRGVGCSDWEMTCHEGFLVLFSRLLFS